MNMGTIAIVLLAAVGAGSVLLLWVMNRTPRRRIDKARLALIDMASRAADADVRQFIRGISLEEGHYKNAEAVISALAGVLGVPASKIAHDVLLKDVFTYVGDDNQRLDPFGYKVVDRLHAICDRDAWEAHFRPETGRPQNEDQLADFLMEKKMGEVVALFSPLVRLS